MNKKQLIEELREREQSISQIEVIEDYCNGEYDYSLGLRDGLVEAYGIAISLIEQMEDEPITAEALEAAGYVPSEPSPVLKAVGYKKICNNKMRAIIVTQGEDGFQLALYFWGLAIFHGDSDSRWVELKATTMTQLRSLEEMFLS